MSLDEVKEQTDKERGDRDARRRIGTEPPTEIEQRPQAFDQFPLKHAGWRRAGKLIDVEAEVGQAAQRSAGQPHAPPPIG